MRVRRGLVLGSGWTARWVTDWRLDGTDVSCPVRDLVAVPLAVAEPVRRFGWRTRQRHRPGLQFMMTAEGVLTYFADRIDPTLEDTIG